MHFDASAIAPQTEPWNPGSSCHVALLLLEASFVCRPLHKSNFINAGVDKIIVVDTNNAADLICECAATGGVSGHKGCNLPSDKHSVNVATPLV